MNDGQPGVIIYLNWFMLLYDEIPLISGGDVAEIKGKNIKDNDTCPILTMISDLVIVAYRHVNNCQQ